MPGVHFLVGNKPELPPACKPDAFRATRRQKQRRHNEQPLLLDREELTRLLEAKILSKWQYIYFALLVDYGSSSFSVHIETFCSRWKITEADFYGAIAQIAKKNQMAPTAKQPRNAVGLVSCRATAAHSRLELELI